MARTFRDDFQLPGRRLTGSVKLGDEPSNLPEGLRLFRSPDPINPFGRPPILQPQQKPIRIWDDPPISPAPNIVPTWLGPLPSPGMNPFPDPSKPRLPPIPLPQQPPSYDLDPSNFPGQGRNQPGGPLGIMLNMVEQGQIQSDVDSGTVPSGVSEDGSDGDGDRQRDLPNRLLALQAAQSRYQPIQENDGRMPSSPWEANFRLVRMPNDASPPNSAAPHAAASGPKPAIQQTEADQSQQAREAAAARLGRGVRSRARAETLPPDPVDIAKSAGIGLVNGVVNAAGLPGDVLTGFGFMPNDYAPAFAKRIGSDAIRHGMEQLFGEFYKPKTTAGRFAETIGEMTPMVGLGAAVAARHGARAALRELPGTLTKHAIAPGVAVQTLEEALPDSGVGRALQKSYPVARRVLPALLAAKRYYLRRRVAPP